VPAPAEPLVLKPPPPRIETKLLRLGALSVELGGFPWDADLELQLWHGDPPVFCDEKFVQIHRGRGRGWMQMPLGGNLPGPYTVRAKFYTAIQISPAIARRLGSGSLIEFETATTFWLGTREDYEQMRTRYTSALRGFFDEVEILLQGTQEHAAHVLLDGAPELFFASQCRVRAERIRSMAEEPGFARSRLYLIYEEHRKLVAAARNSSVAWVLQVAVVPTGSEASREAFWHARRGDLEELKYRLRLWKESLEE
jgi:hypothetical protein